MTTRPLSHVIRRSECPPSHVIRALEESCGFPTPGRVVYACRVGSQAHNTYVPKDDPDSIDDRDVTIVLVPPREKVYGLRPWKETSVVQVDEWDVTMHSLAKYTRLLLKGNPNIVCTLWVRSFDQLLTMQVFEKLYLANRELFSTAAVYYSFLGYASAQRQKMASQQQYQGYMGAKRKALVERFGFDTKQASHLLRLLTMCREFLDTGQLKVYRTDDAELFRSVKRGEWSLADVLGRAETLEHECEEAFKHCNLPDLKDPETCERITAQAEAMLLDVTHAVWGAVG